MSTTMDKVAVQVYSSHINYIFPSRHVLIIHINITAFECSFDSFPCHNFHQADTDDGVCYFA